ncbi:class I SAM-dependent methyltransferase [Maridesulfovibrio frigidus]|uniref:class I SAM-dependent methyltransferase n=1 Tax=Maridesulfovibrio frigidus TaxID=340956 RepID=UPI0004E0CCFE|nr:class I SAM-dependent methyltransferase [Maridesulfovibrio frigidus]
MKSQDCKPLGQQDHWNDLFAKDDAFFGESASEFAQNSLEIFKKNGVRSLLDFGCGQGRDSFLFAQNGIEVTALDYSESAVLNIRNRAKKCGLPSLIKPQEHDVRKTLPFESCSFDVCYSHMLLCMNLTNSEVAFVLREIHRVLKPDGLVFYSVRNNFDKHFRAGKHLSDDIYEIGGFVIHFFDQAKVNNLSKGYELLDVIRLEEGTLPRDLFCVQMKKGVAPDNWEINFRHEKDKQNVNINKNDGSFKSSLGKT